MFLNGDCIIRLIISEARVGYGLFLVKIYLRAEAGNDFQIEGGADD